MFKILKNISFIILFLISVFVVNKMDYPKKIYMGGPYYFLNGEKIPVGGYSDEDYQLIRFAPHKLEVIAPCDEVTLKEAKRVGDYYEVYFDKKGRVIFYKMIVNGNDVCWRKYKYKDGIFLYAEFVNFSGNGVAIRYINRRLNVFKVLVKFVKKVKGGE